MAVPLVAPEPELPADGAWLPRAKFICELQLEERPSVSSGWFESVCLLRL